MQKLAPGHSTILAGFLCQSLDIKVPLVHLCQDPVGISVQSQICVSGYLHQDPVEPLEQNIDVGMFT